MSDDPVLEINNLEKYFEQKSSIVDLLLRREGKVTKAVDGASIELGENESQAVIGESGCGKTTLLMTLMGLYDPTGGEIRFKGKRFSEFDKADWKQYRGNVQMIFQDPFNSLDPKLTVEETIKEPLIIHDMDNKDQRVRDVCEQVELRPPEQYLGRLPDQLSGGEKQRVSIARALVVEPDLILADEPVSMLDVSTQAAILKLLSNLIDDFGVAMLYISHDISTVSYVSQLINVMYLGRIVERAPTKEIVSNPHHPYTQALINAVPVPDPHADRKRIDIKGSAEDTINIGEGCRFKDRCPEYMDICETTPNFIEVDDGHHAACHLYYDHEDTTEEVDAASVQAQEGGFND